MLAAVVVMFVLDYLPVAIVAIGVALSGRPASSTSSRRSPAKVDWGRSPPLLDEAGNSIKGQLAARFRSERLGMDLFASKAEG